jgi:hypothetical protein
VAIPIIFQIGFRGFETGSFEFGGRFPETGGGRGSAIMEAFLKHARSQVLDP